MCDTRDWVNAFHLNKRPVCRQAKVRADGNERVYFLEADSLVYSTLLTVSTLTLPEQSHRNERSLPDSKAHAIANIPRQHLTPEDRVNGMFETLEVELLLGHQPVT